MKESTSLRRRLIFHGRVQGVFFRATTQELAREHGVRGWVRNLPDGTVEAQIQGPAAVLDAFLAALHARYSSNIERMESAEMSLGAEIDFSIQT